MGVPGFFLWLWKKYKGTRFVFQKNKLSKTKDKDLIKKLKHLDYLFLDANSLVHPVCFKVLADNPNLTNLEKLEGKMLNAVIDYIKSLKEEVNPKKALYISIDGVAPVAKIKQQRQRRFKSVHDKILWNNIKRKHNIEIPNSWNNSAITPGTPFMDKLTNKLIEYSKNEEGKVIFSSANTPSEGEHKILQFIKDDVKQNNNNSYVIYGLDADLLFLALTVPTKDIYLLRESVHLRKESSDKLSYVSIDTMKELVVSSMNQLIKSELGDEELDRVPENTELINDFIFICCLIGNDFLPHLPSINIVKNGLDNLLTSYCYTLVTLGGITCIDVSKKISFNQIFLQTMMAHLAQQEEIVLRESFSDKRRRFRNGGENDYEREIFRIENLQFKIEDPVKLGFGDPEDWRTRYYQHYFHTNESEIDKYSRRMSEQYYRGMVWVANYYFDKCPSWNWYYPYDHGPLLVDLSRTLEESKPKYDITKEKFELGKPLEPYMQLLAVLPPQSAFLLPKSLQKIMLNPKSSLAHLYPTDFQQDFINKGRYWQAIPYLPPLEINMIVHAYRKYKNKLSKEEINRSSLKDVYVFE